MIYCSEQWKEIDNAEINDEILIAEFLSDTRKTV